MVHALSPDTHAGRAARTLPRLFEAGAAQHARNVFLLERRADRYEGTTIVLIRGIT